MGEAIHVLRKPIWETSVLLFSFAVSLELKLSSGQERKSSEKGVLRGGSTETVNIKDAADWLFGSGQVGPWGHSRTPCDLQGAVQASAEVPYVDEQRVERDQMVLGIGA